MLSIQTNVQFNSSPESNAFTAFEYSKSIFFSTTKVLISFKIYDFPLWESSNNCQAMKALKNVRMSVPIRTGLRAMGYTSWKVAPLMGSPRDG